MAYSVLESSRSWEVEDIFNDLYEPEEELTREEKTKKNIAYNINWYLQQMEQAIKEFRRGVLSHEVMALQMTRLTYHLNDEVLDYVTT